MTTVEYFSDRHRGSIPRTEDTIPPVAWGGLVALVKSLIATGAFAFKFPDLCPDGAGVAGTDEDALSLTVRAEIQGLEWPLKTSVHMQERYLSEEKPSVPDTLIILDFIEFSYRLIAKPIQGTYHSFFRHHHLSFDLEAGREEFCGDVNRIFARNGIAYELRDNGQITRLLPPVLEQDLSSGFFRTGDTTLDRMLEDSRLKFLSPDPTIRREALERLWDCWERLKSLEHPQDKRQSAIALLDRAADDPSFRQVLDNEARALTDIGNSFLIRHSEVTQSAVTDPSHVDYLFHRLFSLIQLLLKKRYSST